MGELVVLPGGARGELRPGGTVLDHLRRLGVIVTARCGGAGECGSCQVLVVAGGDSLSSPAAVETEKGAGGEIRLACQAVVTGSDEDIVIEVLGTGFLILETGLHRQVAAGPSTRNALREGCQVVEYEGRIVGDYHGGMYGIALDIGTTTVVLRWIDLEDPDTGLAAGASVLNPQVAFGDNVIDRLAHAETPGGYATLVRTVRDAVNRLILAGPVDPDLVYELVFVGNSVMRELFAGHPVGSLARSPFVPSDSGALSVPPEAVGIRMNPAGRVYSPPLPGHFVGADTLAGILATGMGEDDPISMLVDIGTNTEIALGNRDRILVASAASGPAFEGSGVKCGTGAVPGAVRSVLFGATGTVECRTIGDLAPKGICGSGIIDAVAAMREAGIIGSDGRFAKPGVRFTISAADPPVYLDGEDIDAVKLAKAAVASGVEIVLREYGIGPGDIGTLYLAGAFGTSLDPERARAIGLIPDLPADRIRAAGNAAIEGASLMLVSAAARKRAEAINSIISHVSLERQPDFEDVFVRNLGFGRWGV